jgi:hypothetical protein
MADQKVCVCECSSLEHQVSFVYDNEDKVLYVRPRLCTSKNFFQRVVAAIKYVFGYTSKYGEWDEIVITNEDLVDIQQMLNHHTNEV